MWVSVSTRQMVIEMATRRGFLAGLGALTSLPALSWADVGSPAFLAAGKRGDGFVLAGIGAAGQRLFDLELPARGHAGAAHPSLAQAVAFARRPGQFALVIDCATGAVRHRLTPPLGRQFNGHGVYSADGSLLMTSEVVAEGSAGRIGLWDTRTYTRVGEWETGGIGPHDIRRLPDGRLIVANGGIATDPSDRTKLNLPTMRPNLALLSPEGALLDMAELPPELRQNSIRHLALVPGGVAFAMQWEGDGAESVPLLGLWGPGAAPRAVDWPQGQMLAMKGYAGSIAATGDGALIALTSAPGGVVIVCDGAGVPLAIHLRADISGVSAMGAGFVATDGQGVVWACDAAGLAPLSRGDTLWDNHLVGLG